MLTLNIIGKKLQPELLNNKDSLKLLIEPSQFIDVKKSLENLGFNNIVLEDDEGNLYVNAEKTSQEATEKPLEIEKPEEKITYPEPVSKIEIIKNSTGVLISSKSSVFLKKFLQSLINSKINECRCQISCL